MTAERHETLAAQTWFTRAEAEFYTRTSKATILRAVRDNKLEYAKTGDNGDFRFRREWLDRWLAKRMSGEAAAS